MNSVTYKLIVCRPVCWRNVDVTLRVFRDGQLNGSTQEQMKIIHIWDFIWTHQTVSRAPPPGTRHTTWNPEDSEPSIIIILRSRDAQSEEFLLHTDSVQEEFGFRGKVIVDDVV